MWIEILVVYYLIASLSKLDVWLWWGVLDDKDDEYGTLFI